MIHRIFSTLKSFKELHFKPGLNVLLADKGPRSTAKHTRNRAGKSSVLEIIHFLTAAECPDDSIFRCPELIQHRFGMEFDLAGQTVSVERSGASPNDVVVSGGDSSRWPLQPALSAEKGETILPVKDWARVLGALVFGLDDATGRSRAPYSPTFRSLFPYFVRRSPGGFSEPHLHFVQTKPAVWQVGVSYLLGLDWTIPQEWQIVRDEETESFRVLPDFRDYERRAAQLTQQMADLCDGNTLDEELLAELGRAVSQEKPPPIADLRRAYGEVGIALPELTLKRFDEVQKFHESVISNRKSYLEGEIELAKARIEKREADKRSIESERQQIMEILKSHGALDQFSRLQADYGRKTADLELLRKRFAAAEKIEEGLAKLRIRRQQLLLRLKQDYTEQSALLNRAIVTFEEISSQLYQTPAKFTPTETANGPQFKVEVQGERSPGIGNMQIFCFDMMLMKLLFDRNMGPGFLFHDSHLFDPVDARQVGTALALGSTLSQELHFQYVVTLNSDKQIEPPPDFRLSDFQMSTKLTDATESGGLFGIRFG